MASLRPAHELRKTQHRPRRARLYRLACARPMIRTFRLMPHLMSLAQPLRIFGLACALVLEALAEGVPDVLQTVSAAVENFRPSGGVAQTFTAGMNGRLLAVVLDGSSNNAREDRSLQVEILEVDPANLKPNTNSLALIQTTLAAARAASGNGLLRFDFSTNRIQLLAGRPYAIACRFVAPGTEEMSLRSSYLDVSPGGQLWRRSGVNWVLAPSPAGGPVGQDLVMTTWMTPTAAPTVAIRSPEGSAVFAPGAGVPILVEAASDSNILRSVTFYANGLELGVRSAPPFEFTWTNPPTGNHILQASVLDADGQVTWSTPVSILADLDATALPRIRVEDTASPEGNSSLPPLVFPITLSTPASEPITVRYRTRDRSAIAGVDYLATSGTLTFTPGQTRASIFVRMLGDFRDEASRELSLELMSPDGAVIDRPSAIGTLIDDETGTGKPATYRWSTLPDRVVPGVPFIARLTALDPSGASVETIHGNVGIGVLSEIASPGLFLGESEPSATTTDGGFSAGYRFRPKVDILVTHLRTRGGSKVTIWTEQGRSEASASFPKAPQTWQESELSIPLLLKAGSFHRIILHAGHGPLPYGGGGIEGLDWVEQWGLYEGPGDAFPSQPSQTRVLVDFRFTPVREVSDLLLPSQATGFSQGTWEGSLTLKEPAPRIHLFVRDLVGNTGVSRRLSLPVPTFSMKVDSSLPGPAFLLQSQRGYGFKVQTSTDLRSWTDTGPEILSTGKPQPWQPTDLQSPVGFFRLVTTE
jgi:hypothetical protein